MKKLSLSSAEWRFCDSASQDWLPATVPGCVHTDLQAVGKIPDPFFGLNELALRWIERSTWDYATELWVPDEMLEEEVVELVADGLDTLASVSINGCEVGEADNMFRVWRWVIKDVIHPGRNEIRVRFKSAVEYIETTRTEFTPPKEFCDPVGNSVRIRKQPCQFGWDWGPRLVTAGIWRDLRIEAWSGNRLSHVHCKQEHSRRGEVTLQVSPEFVRPRRGERVDAVCFLEGREVARASGSQDQLRIRIPDAKLWWPAGQGEQPLYTLQVTASSRTGDGLGSITKRVGLRRITLDRHADQWGESFQFVVNDRPVFIKGANWIPVHSFVANLKRADYERDLRAAVAANMNCVRLWGGGIYESEDFYDLCDELGLLVWHDFMFACALYPSDRAFVKSVEAEAIDQVKRIHHRACLALWCGNNELVQLNGEYLRKSPALLRGYRKLFHEVLPKVVAEHDGATSYWPTSEWRETLEAGHALGERSGDSHFWDVWHARHPVKDYEKWSFRFCSEFGMQSYSSPATNATFCPPEDANIFGPVMENHQKNRAGNQIILDYVSRRYRFPKSQDDLIYLSQLNQAYCMQTGVEHFRRLMPRCMGALYWQLNDCWPVASWSSIEHTGRWKALHHVARRFYAPALATAQIEGDEESTIGNYRRSTVRRAHLYTVYDGVGVQDALLRWELLHLNGETVLAGQKKVTLRPGESMRWRTLDLEKALERHGRDHVYLHVALERDGAIVSEQTQFLTPPRFMPLPRGVIEKRIRKLSTKRFALVLKSEVFQHAVEVSIDRHDLACSDNFFDLYPTREKEIVLEFESAMTVAAIKQGLRLRSLVDTYT